MMQITYHMVQKFCLVCTMQNAYHMMQTAYHMMQNAYRIMQNCLSGNILPGNAETFFVRTIRNTLCT